MLGTNIVDTCPLSSLVGCGPAHFRGTEDHVSGRERRHLSPFIDGNQLRIWGETQVGRPGSFLTACGTRVQVVNGPH